MIARRKLVEIVLTDLTHGHPSWATDDQRRRANDTVDAFAHELAEQIRTAGGWVGAATDYLQGMDAAADLIDPEVQG
ncbi:hypothetical protein [Streptomyces albipurpureus]|uniref:WXG100 family type VII secretion target n=1 Tax=Streptomyces albipurpureus TaxID=2897419 RepID=A0ABT0UWL2_9ACTN|nr:hypothetical protein [Streptomyces sp. CWNU-1]MCM2391733.1 hypothetical protein [Streptomyces sp. CWNU-1]